MKKPDIMEYFKFYYPLVFYQIFDLPKGFFYWNPIFLYLL